MPCSRRLSGSCPTCRPGHARARRLRSLLNHREGLCVFVDQPQAPMDNNKAELALRGPAIGRRLSFGSDSELGAEFTAMMYTVVGTLKMKRYRRPALASGMADGVRRQWRPTAARP